MHCAIFAEIAQVYEVSGEEQRQNGIKERWKSGYNLLLFPFLFCSDLPSGDAFNTMYSLW